jgi:hypothetical protein
LTQTRRQVRVRHDDPHLGPYTPRGAVIRSAMELGSDVEGLRLYLVTALGDRYRVRVQRLRCGDVEALVGASSGVTFGR